MLLIGLLSVFLCGTGSAQTAQGTINATLINGEGIAIMFNTDPAGVTLGASGTAAATLNVGNISAYGPLSAGVTRTSVSGASFTVSTPFDVEVVGGVGSTNYTLAAQLAGAAPTGFTYKLDTLTLSTVAQNVTTAGTYNTNTQHNLNFVVSTASPASGGPAVGTPLTSTINFLATAN
jgi:hypothetical protein